MKTITKALLYLQITGMLLAVPFASFGAASIELPFHGTVDQVENQTFDIPFFTTMWVEGSGEGNASLLGRFTETFEHVVDLGTFEGVGSAKFTGANGDTISSEIEATAGPVGAAWCVTEHHTVVGGTGRFKGATGSFTLVRYFYDFPASPVSSGGFEGTIVVQRGK